MTRSLEHVGTRMAPCFYVSHKGWPQHADVIHGAFSYPQFWIVYLNETALIKRSHFQPEPCLYWRRVTFKWHMKLVLECLTCLRCGHYKRKSWEYCEVLSAAVIESSALPGLAPLEVPIITGPWIHNMGPFWWVVVVLIFALLFSVLCYIMEFLKTIPWLIFQNFYKEIEREEMYIRYVGVTLVGPSALLLLWDAQKVGIAILAGTLSVCHASTLCVL